MSNTDHNKSGGKSGQKKRKREQQRDQKLERQPRSLQPDPAQDVSELSEAALAPADTSPVGEAAPAETSTVGEAAPVETPTAAPAETSAVEAAPAETAPIGAAASADTSQVGLQTIATAYRDYTRKSFADAQSFVEKLSGARSLDKAFEVQTEFAKRAYETFMADSWRIRALYGELVRQTLKPPTGHRDR
jgi:hypothetical protein